MIGELWKELDAVLLEMEPLKVREREIRAQIKPLQDKKYLKVMGPKLDALILKHEAGADNIATINHIQHLQQKYKDN